MRPVLSENLARLRRARDLSQEELAVAAEVGVDTVGRIERGERRRVRPATLTGLAGALRTSPGVLVGEVPDHTARVAGVDALRRAIASVGEVPGMSDAADAKKGLHHGSLATDTRRAWRWYVDGRHEDLLIALPSLLVEARRCAAGPGGPEEETVHRLLSSASCLAAGLAGRLGQHDLAWIAAERALQAARQSNVSEVQTGIAVRYLAWSLVRQGRADEAERVAISAAERLEPRMLERDPIRIGVFGNLLFNAATAAARAGAGERAKDLLVVAQAAALRTGGTPRRRRGSSAHASRPSRRSSKQSASATQRRPCTSPTRCRRSAVRFRPSGRRVTGCTSPMPH